jgi:hypothetical protein
MDQISQLTSISESLFFTYLLDYLLIIINLKIREKKYDFHN